MIAGEVPTLGTVVPFFFMFEGMYAMAPYVGEVDMADVPLDRQREIKFARHQFKQMKASLARFGGYWMTIDGIRHHGFCDAPLFSPLFSHGSNPRRATQIISKYSLAFWENHLKGVQQPLLKDISFGFAGTGKEFSSKGTGSQL